MANEVRVRMFWSGTWIWEVPSTTVVAWRFLLRAFHCVAECRWPLTPLQRPPVVAPHRWTVLFFAARRRKERTYADLVGPLRGARLVVLAGQVAGRWSDETCRFFSVLAKAKARGVPRLLRCRAGMGHALVCNPVVLSLLELCAAAGTDGQTSPTHVR